MSRLDARLLTSTLAASMESHLIDFTAGESPLEGGTLRAIDPTALEQVRG